MHNRNLATQIEDIRNLTRRGYLAEQIAERLGVAPSAVRELAKEEGLELADGVVGKRRKVRAERVIPRIITDLEGYAIAIDVIFSEIESIDRLTAAALEKQLSEALEPLHQLLLQLRSSAEGTSDDSSRH